MLIRKLLGERAELLLKVTEAYVIEFSLYNQ